METVNGRKKKATDKPDHEAKRSRNTENDNTVEVYFGQLYFIKTTSMKTIRSRVNIKCMKLIKH